MLHKCTRILFRAWLRGVLLAEALRGTDISVNVTILKTADDAKVKKVIDGEKSTC